MKFIETLIQKAKAEVGVVEEGAPNWGPRVSQYLATVGIHFPAYWCAAFLRFCMLEAAKEVGWSADGSLRVSQIPILSELAPRDFAACSMIGGYAFKETILFISPKIGDLMLIQNDEGHFHHTGLVIDLGAGCYSTIEGNTNDDGSRDGYGVFQRERNLGPHSRFVRFADEIAATASLPRVVDPSFNILVAGRPLLNKLVGDRSFVPLRVWARAMDFQFGYDKDGNAPTFNGEKFLGDLIFIDGQNWAPVRALAAFSGLTLKVNEADKVAEIVRG